jgi:aminoglycoside 6'-N-acetyltransferase
VAGPEARGGDATWGERGERTTTPILRGAQVVLRPVVDTDIPALEAILREPEVLRWWMRDSWDRVDEEGSTVFAILTDGAVVGCIEYAEETDPDYRHAGVDLFVSTRAQGRGVGTDALRALLTYLIDDLGHHRVIIDPSVENERAIHVYEKLGFRRVGVMRRYERASDGTWGDGLLMELLAEDFRV